MKNTYYIGLDVHKETIAIAYANGASREDGAYHGQCGGSIPAAVKALRKLAEKLEVEFRDLKVCYEAGPTGFVLARRLIRYGLDCVLMSPSKTVIIGLACFIRSGIGNRRPWFAVMSVG